MPELPEVETVRAGLEPLLNGRTIQSVHCFRKSLRYPLPDFTLLLEKNIISVRRRAKYLLIDIDNGQTLVWHLGMTGQFHVLANDDEQGSHEHVKLILNDGQSLRYRDARRFGYAGIIKTAELLFHPWFAKLGPEPLDEDFNGAYLLQLCKGRKAPIKSVIMDGSVVVGVGNIYACEALFRAGIHPARQAGRISAKRLNLLVTVIKQVLKEAIASGGSTISDFVHTDGKPGYFSHAFQVYGRETEHCFHCQQPIKRMVQSARSTFFCSKCQR